MAIIYRAELSPTKTEILRTFLDQRSWGEPGELHVLGAYRFDDPEGEVGIECHLVQVGETVFHLPLAYRAAPVEGAEENLIGIMDHSVLGQRFVYDGLTDDAVLDCFLRALCGQQEQAELEIYADDGTYVQTRPQSVTLSLTVDEGAQRPTVGDLGDDGAFTVARTVGDLDGTVRLVAAWDGGDGVVAAF